MTTAPLPPAERGRDGHAPPGAGPPLPHRRRPAVAALVSLVVPGLGHVYAGRPRAGLARWLAYGAAAQLGLGTPDVLGYSLRHE